MKFKESPENFYEVPKELMGNCYVYFLLDGDDVVYVGQTTNGMYRPFSHKDKVFNRVVAMPCERIFLNKFEREYILKYTPKYNRSLPASKHCALDSLQDDIITSTGYRLSIARIRSILVNSGTPPHEFNGQEYLFSNEWMPAIEAILKYLDEKENNHNG